MMGEKKSSEASSKASTKRSGRLLSKSSKLTPSTISSPPKAAIATSNGKKDDVHRRRNPLNDLLRRKSADTAEDTQDVPSLVQDVQPEEAAREAKVCPGVEQADRTTQLEQMLLDVKRECKELQRDLQLATEGHEADEEVIKTLRQELSQGSKIRQLELDHSAHNLKLYHDETFNQAKSAHDEDVVQQNYELRYRLAKLQDHLTSQDISQREALQRTKSHSEAEWNDLRDRLHATEKESQSMQQQLLALKSSISSMTRPDAQITDSELVAEFTELSNRVREWVVSNYRRSKMHVVEVSSRTKEALAPISRTWFSIDQASRLAFFQAIVSNAVVHILSQPVSLYVPSHGPLASLRNCATEARRIAKASEYHDWERATVRMLESSQSAGDLRAIQKQRLDELSQDVERILFEVTTDTTSSTARVALAHLMTSAGQLSRMMLHQKARYSVSMYRDDGSPNPTFDQRTMERIDDGTADDDENMDVDRIFAFCVFPGLQKHGDEQGETDLNNILVKASVCCSNT